MVSQVLEIDSWLSTMCYSFSIEKVVHIQGDYVFSIIEKDNNGNEDSYELTVLPNGTIINENNDDVVELSKDSYSNDKEMLDWIKEFEEINYYISK